MTHLALWGEGFYLDGPDAPIVETDTYDASYYCSEACQDADLIAAGYAPDAPAGVLVGAVIEGGALHCHDGQILLRYATVSYGRTFDDETDYDVYCGHCEAHLWHGLQCPDDCTETTTAANLAAPTGPRARNEDR